MSLQTMQIKEENPESAGSPPDFFLESFLGEPGVINDEIIDQEANVAGTFDVNEPDSNEPSDEPSEEFSNETCDEPSENPALEYSNDPKKSPDPVVDSTEESGEQGSRALDSSDADEPVSDEPTSAEPSDESSEEVTAAVESSGDPVLLSDPVAESTKESGEKGGTPLQPTSKNRKKSVEPNKKSLQNRMLLKTLIPKDASSVLNELNGVVISNISIKRNRDDGFTAHVSVNSKMFQGKGKSKSEAKNAACEQALPDIFIEKMTTKISDEKEKDLEAEDFPMMTLASFALHKLFESWKLDGAKMRNMSADLLDEEEDAPQCAFQLKKHLARANLPNDWKTMHPGMVLSYMRPGIVYKYLGSKGAPPFVLFTMLVNVDGKDFTANGTSKKIARRNLAAQVCDKLFGTDFRIEDMEI
ncbi:uncharacterized protein LOC108099748 [Drosophila ficusphila]|uniref:uncharacterized protein LOC108099748 n=1 Tax=Drosophila ficusphila TaxID=30025 RepID=UPI0007E85CDE|nr:uncharacterized protein LOC108099748 [Drosophila ficusphila]